MNHYSSIEQFIQEDLAKSGLTPDSFKVEPLRDEQELRDRLGFTAINGIRIIDVGGYWIEFPNEPGYYRLKLMKEITNENGDKIKYLSPLKSKGKGNHVYMPEKVEKLLKGYTPGLEIGLVEGEKKAQAATDAGIPTIGLTGVWNLNDKDNDFLPELEQYDWKNKIINIAFDSDMTSKPQVKHAELRAAVKFTNRGAKVVSTRLLNEPDGSKNGADDYIVRYGKVKYNELSQQARTTFELLISEDMKTDTFVKEIALLNSIIEKERLVKMLSKQIDVPVSAVRAEMAKHIPQTDKEASSNSKTETFTEEEINAAEALLNNPELLDLAVKQTEKAGHVGEIINKKVLILAFISRLLTDAVSCVVKGPSSSGKNALVRSVLTLFPTATYSDYTSISAKALYYKKNQNLAHRILVIYESHGSEQADYSIRSGISEGKLKLSVTIKDPRTGMFDTQEIEIPSEGLAYVETTTRERVHHENQTRFLDLNVNESKEMNAAVIKEMGNDAANPRDRKALEKESRTWQCAQTLIKDYPVRIPFGPDLSKEFPTHKTRVRRDFPHFLSLIKAHTLLYQRQRQIDEDGYLIATIDDLKAVLQLAEKVLAQSLKEMTPKCEYVLAVIRNEYKPGEEFQVKTFLEKLNNYMNYYNYIKSGFILLFPNGDVELHTKDRELIIIYETIYKELKIRPLLDGGRLPVKVEYQTLQGYLKGFAAEGLLDWNGMKGAGSRYSLSTICDNIIINSTIFTPKFLETLENNYINPDFSNSNQSSNYSQSNAEGTAKEPEATQEGKGEPKEAEPHSEDCDCSKCCPESGQKDDAKATHGRDFESCDDFIHPEDCGCSFCSIIKKQPNGSGNKRLIKTVAIDGQIIKLEYDEMAKTITARRNGEVIYVGWDPEPGFQEYLRYFEGGV